jgi:hypothetical protein
LVKRLGQDLFHALPGDPDGVRPPEPKAHSQAKPEHKQDEEDAFHADPAGLPPPSTMPAWRRPCHI